MKEGISAMHKNQDRPMKEYEFLPLTRRALNIPIATLRIPINRLSGGESLGEMQVKAQND